jgi:hypothetical protein
MATRFNISIWPTAFADELTFAGVRLGAQAICEFLR